MMGNTEFYLENVFSGKKEIIVFKNIHFYVFFAWKILIVFWSHNKTALAGNQGCIF